MRYVMIQQPDRMTEYADSGTVAEIIQNDDAPDECIIFHDPCVASEQVTVWIAAQEGSFVPLDELQ